jgi:hypothetical protein
VFENELRWFLGKLGHTTGRVGEVGAVGFLLGGGWGRWVNELFIIWDMFYT